MKPSTKSKYRKLIIWNIMGKFMVLLVTSRKTSSKGFDFTDLYNS